MEYIYIHMYITNQIYVYFYIYNRGKKLFIKT